MKIVFFDIDGTLYKAEEKRVHTDVQKALKQLQDEGTKIVVATGRSFVYVPQSIRDLKPDGFICSNGSFIQMGPDIWKEKYLDGNEIKHLVSFLDKHGFEYDLQTRNEVLCRVEYRQLKSYQIYSEVASDKIIDHYNLEPYIDKIHKINIWLNNESQWEQIKNVTESFAKEFHAKTHHIELFNLGCSKGTGVKEILNRLSIPKDEAIAFGDSMNDISMFTEVGTSIAMANGDPNLKEIATMITDTVENSGIAQFFQKT